MTSADGREHFALKDDCNRARWQQAKIQLTKFRKGKIPSHDDVFRYLTKSEETPLQRIRKHFSELSAILSIILPANPELSDRLIDLNNIIFQVYPLVFQNPDNIDKIIEKLQELLQEELK
jgi:hypothetical protein